MQGENVPAERRANWKTVRVTACRIEMLLDSVTPIGHFCHPAPAAAAARLLASALCLFLVRFLPLFVVPLGGVKLRDATVTDLCFAQNNLSANLIRRRHFLLSYCAAPPRQEKETACVLPQDSSLPKVITPVVAQVHWILVRGGRMVGRFISTGFTYCIHIDPIDDGLGGASVCAFWPRGSRANRLRPTT